MKAAKNEQYRASKETDLDRLNKLIDWYEKFNPKAGRKILVTFSVKALEKFATRVDEDEDRLWKYRGRQLERSTVT